MLMQAILAGEEEQFWKRIQVIHRRKDDLPALVNDIQTLRGKKDKSQLNEMETILLEIPAFYDGVELYLQSSDHRDVFNGEFITQQKLRHIYSLAKSAKLEQENCELVIALHKLHAFNKDSLTEYVHDLEKIVSRHSDIPILIGSCVHSVLLKYDGKNPDKPWMYADTNNFNPDPEIFTDYYLSLGNEELVDVLMSVGSDISIPNDTSNDDDFLYDDISTPVSKPASEINDPFSFAETSSPTVCLYTTVITKSPSNLDMTKALAELDLKYKIHPEHTKMYTDDGSGLLLIACLKEAYDMANSLISYTDYDIDRVNKKGQSALYIASALGDEKIVSLFLAQDTVDLNKAETQTGVTPFFVACKLRHMAVIKQFLAKKDFNPNIANYAGITPLAHVCGDGDVELVELLLKFPGIIVNQKEPSNHNLLHIACINGNTALVDLLLESREFYINSTNVSQYTPLMMACVSSRTQGKNNLFRKILEKQPDLSQKNGQGLTALDIAFASKNNSAIVEILSYAKDKNISMEHIMSPDTLIQAVNRTEPKTGSSFSKYHFFNPNAQSGNRIPAVPELFDSGCQKK